MAMMMMGAGTGTPRKLALQKAAIVCLGIIACLCALLSPRPLRKEQAPQGTLLLAQAVFRHGARTPLLQMYFKEYTAWANCGGPREGVQLELHDENGAAEPPPILDSDAPILPGGCREGQLTDTGFLMAKDFGSWLRARYTKELPFLSPDFQADEVSLRTTCIARTVATLQGVLAGLWPGAAKAGPISVNASRESSEIEYGKAMTCAALRPRLEALQELVAARDSSDARALAHAAEVAEQLNISTPALNWVRLHDVLAAMVAEGLPLPEGADKKLIQDTSHQAIEREGAIIAPYPEQRLLPADKCDQVIRMSIGVLLNRLQENMQLAAHAHQQHLQTAPAGPDQSSSQDSAHSSVADSQQPNTEGAEGLRLPQASGMPKLFLFSGHDSTMTPLMAALGTPLTVWPPFVSNVVLELWDVNRADIEDDLHVRVLWDRKPLVLEKGWKGGWIRLGDLRAQLAPFTATPQQHAAECAGP